MTNEHLVFRIYQKIEEYKEVLNDSDNGIDQKISNISDLEERVLSKNCKVAVVGEFKRGKSSFINAVLGEKVLPEAVLPWTAVQTEIVFDENETADIWTEAGCKKKVAREELEGWLTKSNKQEEKAKKARIGFPSAFLFDNEAMLVDTPGLNDHEDLDMRTFEMVRDADVLVWMLSNSSPFSASEMNYIINLVRNSKVCNVIFVMNKIDIVEEEDRDLLLQTVVRRINEISEDIPERKAFFFERTTPVFGFSAKYALEAREEHDSELLWESGLPMLLEKLEEIMETVCRRKQTAGVLEALLQQSENEIRICDEKILQWDKRVKELDGCSEYISSLKDYFGDDIKEQAQMIGNSCRQQFKARESEYQRQFHQCIYTRGYGVLKACCDEANKLEKNQKDTLMPTVTDALLTLYQNKKTEYLLKLSAMCETSGLEKVNDLSVDSKVLSFDRYFYCNFFEILDFPGLLLKRKSWDRELYIDSIVSKELDRLAGRWEENCRTWAESVTKELNTRGNELIESQDTVLKKESQECKENISRMTNSAFYNGLKTIREEAAQLSKYAEEDIL